MSYTKGSQATDGGALTTDDSASRGALVRGSRHFRAAREAPRDFGLMAGNVTGAQVLLVQAQQIRDTLMKRQPRTYDVRTYVPTDREAMAELVNATHFELMQVLAEISEFVSNLK